MIRYRFEFAGPGYQPLPDYVYRDAPIVASTVELYSAQRYVVESVDQDADPPLANEDAGLNGEPAFRSAESRSA